MTPADFTRQLKELGQIISDGLACRHAWEGLMVEEADTAQALNRYGAFFLPARVSLFRMMILQFTKVFDRHSRAVSLTNLLKAAQSDPQNLTPHSTPEELAQIEQQLHPNEGLLKRLKALRDHRVAHHDRTPASNMTLLYGEVRQLAEEIKSMYNSLMIGHDRSSYWFDLLEREATNHTSQVVSVMCEERKRATRRIREAERRYVTSSRREE